MTVQRKNVFYGRKVKQLLDDSGLTAVEIAKKAGVERSLLSSYIHQKRNPKRITVQKIADALHVNISEISGYRDDDGAENDSCPVKPTGNEFADALFRYIHAEIKKQVATENQSIVSKRIGLSHPQVNRIVNGKADLSLFPVGALIRLCPQIIDRNVLYENGIEKNNDLATKIEHIKLLAERITDLNVAKTVETMLKGLVEK